MEGDDVVVDGCIDEYLGSTSSTGTPLLLAMSSTVLFPCEMIPTCLAIAFAVMGWSPVTIITLMPAHLHLRTASGTFGLGGSIIDMRPTKLRPSRGKLTSSLLKLNPMGKSSVGRRRSAKPRTLSPRLPRSS